MTKVPFASAGLALIAAIVIGACSSDSGKGSSAAAETVSCPDTCSCEAGSTCTFDCGATGCAPAECLGGTCSGDCPNGNCALDCDVSGSCAYSCDGGGCVSDCDGNSSCELTCAGGGCSMLCDGGSICTLDCAGASQPCLISCEAGAQATCSGNCMMPSCG